MIPNPSKTRYIRAAEEKPQGEHGFHLESARLALVPHSSSRYCLCLYKGHQGRRAKTGQTEGGGAQTQGGNLSEAKHQETKRDFPCNRATGALAAFQGLPIGFSHFHI